MGIIGRTNYTSKSVKASDIQNPCFRYAQKGMAYTLLRRGDNTGMETQWELFFMYFLGQNQAINLASFAGDYLGRVGRVDSGGIFVGGMITQIVKHSRYHAVLLEDTPVASKTKIDMATLIQQGMISVAPNYYSILIHKRFIIWLPDPDRVSITNYANWLYVSDDPDTEEGSDTENFAAGEQLAGEQITDEAVKEEEEPQEQFVPPPQEPFHQGADSSSMNHEQWAWVQTELGDLRTKQTRQGIEKARQGAMLEEMNLMMR